MPKVPVYDGFQATPNALPQVRLGVPEMPDIAGRQAQQVGQGLAAAGGKLGDIALSLQEQANETRIRDAEDRLRESYLQLKHDKDAGFLHVKGINALERPDQKSLADEYADTLAKRRDEIMQSLGNDAQRGRFAAEAQKLLTTMRGEAWEHTAKEYAAYALSSEDSRHQTALRELALGYNNPQAVDGVLQRVEDAAFRSARLRGVSAQGEIDKRRSEAVKTVVLAALENGDAGYAAALFEKHRKGMNADDMATLAGRVNNAVDTYLGTAVGQQVVDAAWAEGTPTVIKQALNIMWGRESGNRQFDSKGRLIVSSAGAVGVGQFMEDTARITARKHGIEWSPEKLRSSEAYNRQLSILHFQDLVKEFGGDIRKAAAAYNCGGKWVHEAAARAVRAKPGTLEYDWFWQLNNDGRKPENKKQTKEYVEHLTQGLARGAGVPAKPTQLDVERAIQNTPALAGRPNAMKTALETGRHSLKLQEDAQKQREAEAEARALREGAQVGHNFSALPEATRAALTPEGQKRVRDTLASLAKGPMVDDPLEYQRAISNPHRLAAMSDDAFFSYKSTYFSQDTGKELDRLRARQQGKAATGASGGSAVGEINRTAMDRAMAGVFQVLGIGGKPRNEFEEARLGAIRRAVDKSVLAAQAEAGKKFNDAETIAHVDTLVRQQAQAADGGGLGGWFKGLFFVPNPEHAFKVRGVGQIPPEELDTVKKALAAQGVRKPSETMLLEAWYEWRMLGAGSKKGGKNAATGVKQ